MPRKVFISFTGLLKAMHDDKVTDEDFENGIYYFGCTRGNVFDRPLEELHLEFTRAFGEDMSSAEAALGKLREVILRAEKEERVAWRELGQINTQAELNELLVRHNARPLNENLPSVWAYELIGIAISVANDGRWVAVY